MDRKRIGWALLALGAVVLVVSAAADPIGLGNGDGIGWKQITGMVVGGAAIVVGIVLTLARRDGVGPAPSDG